MNKLGQFVAVATIVAIGVFLRVFPEVVLKVPGMGFVLYHFIGGAPIPGYIVNSQWENDKTWLRPGDVVVTVATKSGTTWAMATVHAIRTRGVVDYDSLIDVVPWADFVRYPGETLEERMAFFQRSQQPYPFGVYKSHSSPEHITVRSDVKYILGVRDLVDVAASLKTFFRDHTADFSTMWGGFPPRAQSDKEFEHFLLNDKGDGEGFLYMMLKYIKFWWPYIRRDNVLLLHYKDRLAHPMEDIAVLDAFLGTKLSSEEQQNVLSHSNFEYMKTNNEKYAYCLSDAPDSVQRLEGKIPSGMCAMEMTKFVAKGKDRDGNIELSPELVTAIRARVVEFLGPEIAAWLQSGGPPPDTTIVPSQ